MKQPRKRYINEAIDHHNRIQKRKLIEKALAKESDLLKSDSMKVLRDFESIDFTS